MHTTIRSRAFTVLALAAGLACPSLALGQAADGKSPKAKPAKSVTRQAVNKPEVKPETKHQKTPEMKRLEKLKNHADTDGDGVISESEREAAKAKMKARHEAIRAKIDTNSDGTISPEEWHSVSDQWRDFDGEFDRAMKSLEGPARNALVKSLDTNGNGQIDPNERAGIRARAEQRRLEVIARFDADHNGVLNDAERQALNESLKNPPKAASGLKSKGAKNGNAAATPSEK